jgi:hypothetical protein
MSADNWTFDVFSNWLTRKSEVFRENGYIVELQRHDGPRSSIRLRAERSGRVGELTVWDDGMASEAVIDLKIGAFVHMRDGTILTHAWDRQLEEFFRETAKGAT